MLLHRKLGAGGGMCSKGWGGQRRNCASYNNPAAVPWGMWRLRKNEAILYFRSALSFAKTSGLLLQMAINNAILIIMW